MSDSTQTQIAIIREQMKDLTRRIDAHDDTFKWIMRIIVGAVILAVVSLVLVKPSSQSQPTQLKVENSSR